MMHAVLRFDPFLRRKARVEPWEDQGRSTLKETRLAVRFAEPSEAIEMFDCYVTETRWLYDGYLAWVKDWVTAIGRRDCDQLWSYLSRAHEHLKHLRMLTLPVEINEEIASVSRGSIEFVSSAGYRLRTSQTIIPAAAWQELGREAETEFQRICAGGDREGALEQLDRVHREHKPVHDAYSDWLWLWMTILAERWGEQAMFELMMQSGHRLRTVGIKALPSIPIDEQVRIMAAAMRGHRSGPGEEGDIRIIEDHEKFVIEFDACGSGGRMRRRGEIDGLAARQDAPFNLGSSQSAGPMSWGRRGVPYYCSHCAAYSEILSTDLIGYPSRVTLFNPDANKPCAWAFYKSPDAIPEEYFLRIGRTRDPSKFAGKT